MQIVATENTIYTSPDASKIFCYTPSILVTPTGRLIVSFDLGGEGVKSIEGHKSSRAGGSRFGQGKIFISDDNGQKWTFVQNFPFWHARLFTIGNSIYLIGHIYEASSEQSNPLIADFNVMRLEKDREPRLRIADKTGTIRYDENLIGKLIGGNPNIDFEHNHDFTIEISFDNYIPVIIKINGWEIVNEEI